MIRDASFCLFMIKEFKTLKPATKPCPTIPGRPFLFTARVQVIRYASFRWTKKKESVVSIWEFLIYFLVRWWENRMSYSPRRNVEVNITFYFYARLLDLSQSENVELFNISYNKAWIAVIFFSPLITIYALYSLQKCDLRGA